MLDNVKMEQVEVVLLGRVELGQVTVEQVVEALRGVEVVGMEVAGRQVGMAGRQVEVVVGGHVMVEKPGQVARTVGEAARPCQSSSSSRGKTFGKWIVAAASGKMSTRRGWSR